MERTFLYIDILGFENLVKTNSSKVDKIFSIFNSLNVFKHYALQTIVFSDTILVFNKDESLPTHYYCTYLVEYTQELFYKLSLINVYFKGILTKGDFNFSQLSNIQAYYGQTLIEAYHNEGDLEGFGLFVDMRLSNEIVSFDKVPYTEKYEFILLCQYLKNLYSNTSGILPVDDDMLTETDSYFRIDEDLRFLREIEYLKDHHPDARVRCKHQKVYDTYKNDLPLFFKVFEKEGFLPLSINSSYYGSFNPFEILAMKELNGS